MEIMSKQSICFIVLCFIHVEFKMHCFLNKYFFKNLKREIILNILPPLWTTFRLFKFQKRNIKKRKMSSSKSFLNVIFFDNIRLTFFCMFGKTMAYLSPGIVCLHFSVHNRPI